MILDYNFIYLCVWVGMIILYFGFIEIWAMCSHCPHYAEPLVKSLKCWANYGSPKIWKYKPGPMSLIEKIIFFAGMALVLIFPLIFSMISVNLFDLALYLLILIGFSNYLLNFLCTKCMNFACPLNRVLKKTKDEFLKYNPEIAKAWQKKINKEKY